MNKNIFKSHTNTITTNSVNPAGAPAYSLSNEEAIAQLVATGTFQNTFYTKAEDQLKQVQELAHKCSDTFLAKLAIYARTQGYMKDSPAVLLAILSRKNPTLFRTTAKQVLDNVKMVRNLVQIIRSGNTGRKSLGSAPKKAIQYFFNNLTDQQLFAQSIGQSPSMADIIKLAHVKPMYQGKITEARTELFKYILGFTNVKKELLPQNVQDFEAFKADNTLPLPRVDWQMLSSFSLNTDQWIKVGSSMNWHALRMNLNTLARHNALDNQELVQTICRKLVDKTVMSKVKVFPYQLFATYLNTQSTAGVPTSIKNAVQDALDISVENVPALTNVTQLFICIDTSGSMSSPVTGYNGSATSSVRCIDAAAMFAASFAKVNKTANVTVIGFDHNAKVIPINTRDSLVTIAQNFNTPGGGTNCSSAMQLIQNQFTITKKDNIAVIYISDNCSWAEYYGRYYSGQASPLSTLWEQVARKAGTAKMVLIDVQPFATTQHQTTNNVLNVGGFSDAVYDVVTRFLNNGNENWTTVINSIPLVAATTSSPVMESE